MSGLLLLIAFAALLIIVVLTTIVVYDATHPVRRSGAYAAVRGLPFDPGDLGLKFEAWTLDRPRAKLAVWEVELTPGESPRETKQQASYIVVLIHGWGQSRIDWLQTIEFWHERASRALLYDLRGHGESGGTSRLGNREDDDLLILLEHLGRESKLLLVGRDLGANIAITAAARESGARNRIAGVIAIAPYHEFRKKMVERLKSRDFPAQPMANLAMAWLSLTRRKPLTIERSATARAACPLLELPEWNDAEVAKFLGGLRLKI